MKCPQCGREMKPAVATNNLPIWLCQSCPLVRSRPALALTLAQNTPIAKVPRVQHEHLIQTSYFDKIRAHRARHPILKLIHSVPNGGHRSKVTAYAMMEEGQQPGVPDIHIACARRGFHAMWIEMKDQGRGPSEAQFKWKDMLESEGQRWVLCFTAEDAWRETLWYLSLPAELL